MSSKKRLDHTLLSLELVATRSQAESYIRMGAVTVDGKTITKPGFAAKQSDKIKLNMDQQYVSRAGHKLASVAGSLHLDFSGKTVLDVGASTGGFTDYALVHRAHKVIAVEAGTNQLHPSLRGDSRIELHEQTDLRSMKHLSGLVDYVLIDVSFISIREILLHLPKLIRSGTLVVAMVKPQFEASASGGFKHKGVIKNEAMRRSIFREFELWVRTRYKVVDKADSHVGGEKGNKERFYLLSLLAEGK